MGEHGAGVDAAIAAAGAAGEVGAVVDGNDVDEGVRAAGRPARRRHETGDELSWRRAALLPLVILLAVTAALGTAGILRRGPLAALGWSERELTATAVSSGTPLAASVSLDVAVPWPADARCPARLTVDVIETSTVVRIGPVRGHLSRIGTQCHDVVDGKAFVRADLGSPIGDRQIVRAADNARLPLEP